MGHRRMTLTYPILNRSRKILWLVTGGEKVAMLPRLQAGDTCIPAGGISREQALILADRAAAGKPYLDRWNRPGQDPAYFSGTNTTQTGEVTFRLARLRSVDRC